jgi:hypothetical protein
MRTGKVMKCIVTMMLLCIGILPVMAQKNIDKVVKELEGRSDVSINSVTRKPNSVGFSVFFSRVTYLRSTRVPTMGA